MRAAAALLALLIAAPACQKPSREDCEASCLHYRKLQLAEELAGEGDGEAPDPDELEAAWEELRGEEETEKGLSYCVDLCRNEGSPQQAACVSEAETIAEADDCLE